MAWSGGTFTRTNGVFTGALVWTDDKNAGTKIVSDHHDTHDQDLAQGINACLNKNGQNSPTASINWGGFKITGLANGSDTSDSATYGQTTTSATLDPTSNILTLVKAGDTDVTVDLSALAVGGSTTDFARYSNHANPFQGLATFAGTLSCDYALQLADQISGSGIYTWGLVANTSGNFGIGPLSGSDNQFILTATPSSAYASVGGNRIWDAGNLTPAAIAGMLTLDGSYTITGELDIRSYQHPTAKAAGLCDFRRWHLMDLAMGRQLLQPNAFRSDRAADICHRSRIHRRGYSRAQQ